MSAEARELNTLYLQTMLDAPEETVLGRVRLLWWEPFARAVRRAHGLTPLDTLDSYMDGARTRLVEMAGAYAAAHGISPDKQVQLQMQFLKSNTGKMFERFVGLAVAHVLREYDAAYCILPCKQDFLRFCPQLRSAGSRDIKVRLGNQEFVTPLDADVFAFDPCREANDIYFISIKSTLKDRFHAVPFWNLLRRGSISNDCTNMSATKPNLMRSLKYVAICTDLAEEQPDFTRQSGPRNLLQIDAALLDGGFVTASRAVGVLHSANCIGPNRDSPFNWLSDFVGKLIPLPA